MMSTSQFVNYSLRPSKNIQRQLAFKGIRILKSRLNVANFIYIGFGSIWFTDFVMAHNMLNIDKMISMEEDETIFHRAVFNAPYASVDVRRGPSSELLPTLCDNAGMNQMPWVVWLDYDKSFDEVSAGDTRTVLERAPKNTILLVTFNGMQSIYGRNLKQRLARIRDVFGDVVPDDTPARYCSSTRMYDTLADFAIDFMKAAVAAVRRPGGFVPSFRMIYRDGPVMVTVGGILPSSLDRATSAREVVESETWRCRPEEPIVSPLLTMRESMALQSLLPRQEALSRNSVTELGFDLKEEQIRAYEKYYKEYPAFAQIVI